MTFNPLNFLKCEDPPEKLAIFINATGPITPILKNLTNEAKINLINQGWANSTWWEKEILNVREKFFLREIVMTSKKLICWYARTIIPLNTYSHHETFFSRLRDEPLTKLIFNTSGISRGQVVKYKITGKNLEYYWFKWQFLDQALWVRMTEYIIGEHSFYLNEIFLPDLDKIL